MPDLPKVAVVGLGAFGRLHAGSLKELEGVKLTALVEPDTERREASARELGVPQAFASMDELINVGAADAAVIATRADSHVALAVSAMKSGLDVLIEKPAAETIKELEQLVECQRSTGRVAMVNHICLFHSLVDPLLKRVSTTGFRAAHFVRHRHASLARRFPEAHPLHLLIVHDLYVAARMVQGEDPCGWHFMESVRPGGNADMTWVSLRWKDGRVATFQSHCTLPSSAPADGWDVIEVFGDGFHSRVQTNPAPWQWQGEQQKWPVALEISNVHGRPTGMLAEAQRSFIAAIQGKQVPQGCRLEDALQIGCWTERIMKAKQAL